MARRADALAASPRAVDEIPDAFDSAPSAVALSLLALAFLPIAVESTPSAKAL